MKFFRKLTSLYSVVVLLAVVGCSGQKNGSNLHADEAEANSNNALSFNYECTAWADINNQKSFHFTSQTGLSHDEPESSIFFDGYTFKVTLKKENQDYKLSLLSGKGQTNICSEHCKWSDTFVDVNHMPRKLVLGGNSKGSGAPQLICKLNALR